MEVVNLESSWVDFMTKIFPSSCAEVRFARFEEDADFYE